MGWGVGVMEGAVWGMSGAVGRGGGGATSEWKVEGMQGLKSTRSVARGMSGVAGTGWRRGRFRAENGREVGPQEDRVNEVGVSGQVRAR